MAEITTAWEQMEIGELRPVRRSHRAGRNKAGRLVARGRIGEREVKMYEAASSEHARFIQAVSRHEQTSGLFPTVIDVHGSFVLAEWVHSHPDAVVRPQDLGSLLSQIHHVPWEQLPAPGFDYWHDYVYPRFASAAEILGELALAEDIGQQVSDAWRRPACLMHPDCTRGNVVRNTSLGLRIIDNELLSVGGFPLLDLANAVFSLEPKSAGACVTSYRRMTDIQPTRDDRFVLEAVWLARRVGSAHVAGDLELAASLIACYRSGNSVLSPATRLMWGG